MYGTCLYNRKEELTKEGQSVYFIIVFDWDGNKMYGSGICKFEKGLGIMVGARGTTQVIWKLEKKNLQRVFNYIGITKIRLRSVLFWIPKYLPEKKHWVTLLKLKIDKFK